MEHILQLISFLTKTTLEAYILEEFYVLKFLFFFFFGYVMWHVGELSSLTRDWTQAPAVKPPRPNHWTTRELLKMSFQSHAAWIVWV